VEFGAICRQIFRSARLALDSALSDEGWTAAVEQTSVKPGMPGAVIVDADETVLDNSASQARQVKAGAGFETKAWNDWVAESAAGAIPGAAGFCRYAAARGVTVFYVTNREVAQEAATRANLAKLGFPLRGDIDTLLLRGEKPEWGSDKGTRRAHVAAQFRVLLLVGDDLNDFLSGVRTNEKKRAEISRAYSEFWGLKWFLLPNPSYGSWEEALYSDPKPADAGMQLKQKLVHLKTGQ
jgi:acid phosphatase